MIVADFSKRYLSDEELALLQRNPEYSRFLAEGKKCPVCFGDGSESGTYRFEGEEYECPQDDYGHIAIQKAKLYWLHNIPMDFQRLPGFPTNNPEREAVREDLDAYIENYPFYAQTGAGITFYSKMTGTGKTWAATYVLKELVKRGYDGWFAPFYDVKGYFEIEDPDEKKFKIKKVRESGLLVLDEVITPGTSAQQRLFAEKLEQLIRPRGDAAFPTIITTNMTPEEIEAVYPRCFSLMSAKNLNIEMTGQDARLTEEVTRRNIEIPQNRESWPIT